MRTHWPRRRRAIFATVLATVGFAGLVAVGGGIVASAAPAESASSLPSCPFWTSATPPARSPGPFTAPPSLAPRYSLAGRPAAPTFVSGQLANGAVTITFDAVPGATSYRLSRNSIAVQWVTATGASTYTVTDPDPCQGAFYTLVANPDGTTGTEGHLSHALQLGANGVVRPWVAPGTSSPFLVTSYNDPGTTSTGYQTGPGMCAVDPRLIPLGTRFWVKSYGWCYAGDIGTWIQGHTVDVWLSGSEANGWGVQDRTIKIGR